DNREVPDTLEVLWQYPGNTLVTFSQYNATAAPAGLNGGEIELRGTKGTLYFQNRGYQVVPEVLSSNEAPAPRPTERALEGGYRTGRKAVIEAKKVESKDSIANTAPHARNFLDCVKSRQKCNCDIETGHRETSATLIGNIAHKLKAYLEW